MRARSRGAAMLCRLLALMAVAVTLASAQLSNLFGEGRETYTIAPNDCLRVRLGGTEADRASFAVSSRPALDVSGRGSCSGLGVRQALPQSAENFALASYDEDTLCREVLNPTERPLSYGQMVNLRFADVALIGMASIPYHVCTDATWMHQGSVQDPVDTYVWFHNPCDQPQSISVNVTRLGDDEAAEEFCDRLETQNEGELLVWSMMVVGSIVSIVSVALGGIMVTACCSCWCCCARPGMCAKWASPASERRFQKWSDSVSKLGLGWVMGKAGGIQFYTDQQSRAVLFWTFAATCLTTFLSTNYPLFFRDDTLDPDSRDSRSSWGVPFSENPTASFALSLLWAAGASIGTYGAIVLTFSDPLRDPSFRSKAITCGLVLFCSLLHVVLALVDTWRYLHLWDKNSRSFQFTLQMGVMVTQVMSVVSYIQFVWEAHVKRCGVREANNGQLPDIIDTTGMTARFTALKKPQSSSIDSQSSGSASQAPMAPVAAVAQLPNHTPAPTAFPYGAPTGTPAVRMESEMPTLRGSWGMSSTAGPVGEAFDPHAQQQRAQQRPAIEAGPVPTSNTAQPTSTQVAENPPPDIWAWDNTPVGGGGLSMDVTSQPPSPDKTVPSEREESEVPESAEQMEEKRTWRSWLEKIWESVCEDPRIGFKYSMFVSASLLVTFVINTAALMRALHWVRELAWCTDAGSTCLFDVQVWLYNLILSDFVRVDPVTLELWARGLCEEVASSSVALLEDRLPANLLTTEVAERCAQTAALPGLQGAPEHPKWLSNSKAPVLVGGHVGLLVAYCLGLYTIFNVAKAYKKLELKLRAARIADLLAAYHNMGLAEVVSAAPSSAATSKTAGGKPKVKLGKNIIEDYKTVSIGQSAYFTGTLVSTCFVQLWLASVPIGVIIGLLLHPQFWSLMGKYIWWPLSTVLMLLWHIGTQVLLNTYVTDGKRIKKPFVWLFTYVALSAGYCVVAVLLALWRLIYLALTSILALSRLDECLFTVMRSNDRGYASFLAMSLMLHSLQECLKENKILDKSNVDATAVALAGKLPGPRVVGPADAVGRWRTAAHDASNGGAAVPVTEHQEQLPGSQAAAPHPAPYV